MSRNGWHRVAVGDVLTKSEDVVTIDPARRYEQVTVRLWGRGVVPRGTVSGIDLAGDTRFRIRAGQFIMSRIDARHGAFGLVPPELDGAVASNDFPSFDVNVDRLRPAFLAWLCRTHEFVDMCRAASEGTTNRVRLKEDRFLATSLEIPDADQQDRIAAKLDDIASRIGEAREARAEIEDEAAAMLRSAFVRLVADAPRRPMREAAPLVRRSVELSMGAEYPELGVRSFGKGTFHKPALDFMSVGTKMLYRIEPGDLVFNNVFAWEGAIAVAQPQDAGRVGSHRFITCVPRLDVATADFLCFYFLTPEGLDQIGKASPGGAGRNRTLGLEKLAAIDVPVPAYHKQLWFDQLQAKVRELAALQRDADGALEAMLPSVLDRAFCGRL